MQRTGLLEVHSREHGHPRVSRKRMQISPHLHSPMALQEGLRGCRVPCPPARGGEAWVLVLVVPLTYQ